MLYAQKGAIGIDKIDKMGSPRRAPISKIGLFGLVLGQPVSGHPCVFVVVWSAGIARLW